YKLLEDNCLQIPFDKPLPGCRNPVPYLIVADAAFSLKRYMMKPYPFKGLTDSQAIFNYLLSRARRIVGNSFGILANKFRILLGKINLSADKTRGITLACCALHNFLLSESHLYQSDIAKLVDKEVPPSGLRQQGGNHPSATAMEIREKFQNYFNDVGAVEWQNNMV
ncbi:hypothetical protein ILUMI_17107, partial [Ignelater luminosus]